MRSEAARRSFVASVFLLCFGLLAGCGGGSTGPASLRVVSVTGPLQANGETAFVVSGDGFSGPTATVRFAAATGTPSLHGTSAVLSTGGAVDSATRLSGIHGTMPPLASLAATASSPKPAPAALARGALTVGTDGSVAAVMSVRFAGGTPTRRPSCPPCSSTRARCSATRTGPWSWGTERA